MSFLNGDSLNVQSGSRMDSMSQLERDKFDDENCETPTSKEQIQTEGLVRKCYERFQQLSFLDNTLPHIERAKHTKYLDDSLCTLATHYQCLDSSRPWLVYWILNAAQVIRHKFSPKLLDNVVQFLVKCRSPVGGFGGGPGQSPHLAPTYAAVNSLCIIGTPAAYAAIDRRSLKRFLLSVREDNGAYRMHVDGELDVRGAYCAISSMKLANFSKEDEQELFNGTAEWIASCQTYEGGMGGAPGLEAHGGYTFCGIAGMALLGDTSTCNLQRLLGWCLQRQMSYEGGFQGRTNKLVDGCYSFWQAAIVPICQALLSKNDPSLKAILQRPLLHREALQEYVLICCQFQSGGLIDKPGKNPDLYHTCYTLSGLSIAQHCGVDMHPIIVGSPNNELVPVHPLHNIPPKSVWDAIVYFQDNNYDMFCDKNTNGIWSETDDERADRSFQSPASSVLDEED